MPQGDPAESIATLVEEVVREARSLRTDITEYELAHRRERRAYTAMAAVLIAAITVCVILIATARAGLKSQEATLARVNSCTTPGGECYERQRHSQADFRQRILGVVAVITDCDVYTDDLEEFRDCVTTRTGLHAAAVSQPVDLGEGYVFGTPVDPNAPIPTPSQPPPTPTPSGQDAAS